MEIMITEKKTARTAKPMTPVAVEPNVTIKAKVEGDEETVVKGSADPATKGV